ncbi:hypothetical protein BP5796_03049 [Coleophoma crateriformis]|uniref:C2H2-type domain-containing protein n=1 Tax=Coleophoma crateriformis TaxID=565419 RepID=A0A3D8SM07_9HELO|nr:hypothetical protein BP5796_03049 [Coleophoma crateriformis]
MDISPSIAEDKQDGEPTFESPSNPTSLSELLNERMERKLIGTDVTKPEYWDHPILDMSDTTEIKTAAGTASSRHFTTTNNSSSTETNPSRKTVKKRCHEVEDDYSFPDEDDAGMSARRKRGYGASGESARKLGCPYRKKDPRKYNIHGWRSCVSGGWDSISRVKEHLYRCHMAPPQCLRCKATFKSDEDRNAHLVETVPCLNKPGEPPDGITDAKMKALKSRKSTNPSQPQSERWKDVYRTLFPNNDAPEPWSGSAQEMVDLDDFEAYFQQELQKFIRSCTESTVTDQVYLVNMLRAVQHIHSLVLSNYRSQLSSSPPTFVCTTSAASSIYDSNTQDRFISISPAPAENNCTPYVSSGSYSGDKASAIERAAL